MTRVDATIDPPSDASPHRRPRFFLPRFGLRGLFVFAILFCLASAWVGTNYARLRQEEAATEALKRLGVGPHGSSPGERIGRILGYASRPPTREMHLDDRRADERQFDHAIAALATFPEIEILRLSGPAFDDDAMTAVANLPELKSLDLDATTVTATGLEKLAPLAELRQISLQAEQGELEMLPGLAALPELRSVTIVLATVSRSDISYVASLPKLEGLCLYLVSAEEPGAFTPLANAKALKTLQLELIGLGDAELDVVASLPVLEEIVVGGIDDDSLQRLRPGPALRKIQLTGPVAPEVAKAFSAAYPDCLVHLWSSTLCYPGADPSSMLLPPVELFLRNGEEVQP